MLIKSLAFSQIRLPNFFEVIKGDSVSLFFDHNFSFTEKQCAEFTRFTRANTDGDFRGEFIDVDLNNDLLGTGRYVEGKKDGYFEIYYPAGKLKCKGNYSGNAPTGQWSFFYENGLPERIIEVVGDETILVQSVDKSGKLRVSNGQGFFKGIVISSDGKVNLIAKGRVVNGKPDGKWKSWYPDHGWRYRYSNEIYRDGKYVKGKVLRSFQFRQMNSISYGGRRDTVARKAMRRLREFFKNYQPCLNNYFLDSYLNSIEQYRFHRCDTIFTKNQNYILNLYAFRNELINRLDQVIKNELKHKTKFEKGFYYLTLKFSVSEEGQPENFEEVSTLGNEFGTSIASALTGLTTLHPEKELYIRIKFNFQNPFQYRFSYRITKDKLKIW